MTDTINQNFAETLRQEAAKAHKVWMYQWLLINAALPCTMVFGAIVVFAAVAKIGVFA